MHSLPNFNKIGQREAELLTIEQVFPVSFMGHFVAVLLGTEWTELSTLWQDIDQPAALLKNVFDSRYVAPVRNYTTTQK